MIQNTSTPVAGKKRKATNSEPPPEGCGSNPQDESPKKKKSAKPKKPLDSRFGGKTEEELMELFLPDHLQPDLDIVFIGINPGLLSAYLGHHYCNANNHFWPCMYESGLVPRRMTYKEDAECLNYGIGFTNIVPRTTRSSNDLSRKEIKDWSGIMIDRMKKLRPLILCFNGKGIYEIFIGKKCEVGLQPVPLPDTKTSVYVMPSTSGRAASHPRRVDKLKFFHELKQLRDNLKKKHNGPNTDSSDPDVAVPRESSSQMATPLVSSATVAVIKPPPTTGIMTTPTLGLTTTPTTGMMATARGLPTTTAPTVLPTAGSVFPPSAFSVVQSSTGLMATPTADSMVSSSAFSMVRPSTGLMTTPTPGSMVPSSSFSTPPSSAFSMIQTSTGLMATPTAGSMVPSSSFSMVQPSSGLMATPTAGSMVPSSSFSMVQTSSGLMAMPTAGSMVPSSSFSMVQPSSGLMATPTAGSMVPSSSFSMVQTSSGLMAMPTAGSMVPSSAFSMIQTSSGSIIAVPSNVPFSSTTPTFVPVYSMNNLPSQSFVNPSTPGSPYAPVIVSPYFSSPSNTQQHQQQQQRQRQRHQ